MGQIRAFFQSVSQDEKIPGYVPFGALLITFEAKFAIGAGQPISVARTNVRRAATETCLFTNVISDRCSLLMR